MSDQIWRREEIESPCIKICAIHPAARICVGCGRTGDEIAAWSAMNPAQRRAVMQDLPARMETLTAPQNRPSRRRGDHRAAPRLKP